MRDSPWPVVPRPFHDETFGSWFGRLALRYRIDVDQEAVMGIAGSLTPVPGGVGPMTIAMLLSNTLTSHARRLGL